MDEVTARLAERAKLASQTKREIQKRIDRGDIGTKMFALGYERVREVIGDERELVWGSMIYRCQGAKGDRESCGFETRYYLCVGCEGPPELRTLAATIPVPFFAGGCPKCGGRMAHDRWNEDEEFAPRERADDERPYFIVPSKGAAKRYVDRGYGGADLEGKIT